MKNFLYTVAITCVALPCLQAQFLNNQEKEEAMQWLDDYQNRASDSRDRRVRDAHAALIRGAGSEQEALNLYKSSKKKVDFDDKHRTESAYAAWEKEQRDTFNKPGFKKAIQIQCKWILLGSKIALAEKNEQEYNAYPEIMDMMSQVANSEEIFKSREGFQAANVIKSALKINDMRPEQWVENPTEIAAIFDNLILPDLKKAGNIANFRSHWMKRIEMEKKLFIDPKNLRELEEDKNRGRNTTSSSNNKGKSTSTGISGQRAGSALRDVSTALNDTERKLRSEKAYHDLSALMWKMEMECYQVGDEKTALNNMKDLIVNTKDPADMEKRLQQLTSLIKGEALPTPGYEKDAPENTIATTASSGEWNSDWDGQMETTEPDVSNTFDPSPANTDDTADAQEPAQPQPAQQTPTGEGGMSNDDWDL